MRTSDALRITAAEPLDDDFVDAVGEAWTRVARELPSEEPSEEPSSGGTVVSLADARVRREARTLQRTIDLTLGVTPDELIVLPESVEEARLHIALGELLHSVRALRYHVDGGPGRRSHT